MHTDGGTPNPDVTSTMLETRLQRGLDSSWTVWTEHSVPGSMSHVCVPGHGCEEESGKHETAPDPVCKYKRGEEAEVSGEVGHSHGRAISEACFHLYRLLDSVTKTGSGGHDQGFSGSSSAVFWNRPQTPGGDSRHIWE